MSIILDGTNGIVSPTGALYPLNSGTAVASTSGTSIDFTGIPSTAKRITVILSAVSTNGVSNINCRLGDSTGFYSTGYTGNSTTLTNAAAVAIATSTTGLIVSATTAITDNCVSTISWVNVTGNTWVGTSSARTNGTVTTIANGTLTTTNVVNSVRITMANGTDTFDAGTINILWE